MRPIRISATAHSSAEPSRVFAILKDAPGWPSWSIFDSVEFERPGQDEPHGVGSIHTFVTRLSRSREEVVELIPDRRLSYIVLSGFPIREYRAVVEIAGEPDGGSRITWSSSFFPKYRGTGWFWRLLFGQTLKTVSRQLARAAEARETAIGMAAPQT